MKSERIEQLRHFATTKTVVNSALLIEALDEIEKLQKALEEIADMPLDEPDILCLAMLGRALDAL